MLRRTIPVLIAAILLGHVAALHAEPQTGDAKRGAKLFGACAACHSLAPQQNMTGPSLARLWGRKAGSLKSFDRYSPALKASGVVWDDGTLDRWLASPSRFIPNNFMTFRGISDAKQRADLLAFLKEASSGQMQAGQGGGSGGGMMGGMRPRFTDLKTVGPDRLVRSIRMCRDSYFVTTADGRTVPFWENNLRLKTDSGATGPRPGQPAILPAGMMGDRATVFFAAPAEISPFIKHRCEPGEKGSQP